jgi:hypothetical protein
VFHRLQLASDCDAAGGGVRGAAVRWLATATLARQGADRAAALHGLTFGMFRERRHRLWSPRPRRRRCAPPAGAADDLDQSGQRDRELDDRAIYDAHGARLLFLLAAIGELAPLAVVLAAAVACGRGPGCISSPPC